MNESETKVYKKTKLRNLKRRYSKLIHHPEFTEECIELKAEIDYLKRELNS